MSQRRRFIGQRVSHPELFRSSKANVPQQPKAPFPHRIDLTTAASTTVGNGGGGGAGGGFVVDNRGSGRGSGSESDSFEESTVSNDTDKEDDDDDDDDKDDGEDARNAAVLATWRSFSVKQWSSLPGP